MAISERLGTRRRARGPKADLEPVLADDGPQRDTRPTVSSSAPARRDRHARLLTTVFFLSGAAGLIYQVVWTHDLILLFGDTTQGIVTSVSAFLAGLGTGAALAGALVTRLRAPIRLYAAVELLIGIFALPMPLIFSLISTIFRQAYLSMPSGEVAMIRFLLAFVSLAPVTLLMGATLPILTRHIVRTGTDVGPWVARLYSANTLGAVAGTLVSGLLLIELIGLESTTLVAIACNVCAATGAAWVARCTSKHRASVEIPRAPTPRSRLSTKRRCLVLVTFVSGFCSLSFEVLWNRALTQETGGTIYYFVAILAIFLFGIALGSRIFEKWVYPVSFTLLGGCLAAVGPLAIVPVLLANVLGPHAFDRIVVVLVFPTVLLGFTFPLTVKLFVAEAGRAAGGLAFLYFSNTAGCVLGTVVSGFVLVPAIGTNSAVVATSLLLWVTGWTAVVAITRRRSFTMLVAGSTAVCLLALATLPLVRLTYTQRQLNAAGLRTHHYEDVVATVDTVSSASAAQRQLLINGVGITALTVDTKLLVYLPYIARPSSQTILIVCFGMGTSYRTAILLGLRTQAVELDPTVPTVMPTFFADAKKILASPLGSVRIDDGLSYVKLTSKRYNIIVTDAPPPSASAGALELLTKQYYLYARSRLSRNGIMSVFIPYGTSACDLRMEVRTFASVFGYTDVFVSLGGSGLQLIGSQRPISFPAATVERVLGSKTAEADMRLAPDSPRVSEAKWPSIISANLWLQGPQIGRYLGQGPVVTEDHPLTEYDLLQGSLLRGCQQVNYLPKAKGPFYTHPAPFPPGLKPEKPS